MDCRELMDGQIRPIEAAKAFYRLVQDKDDTAAVVIFITAMNGDWYGPIYERFRASADGARMLAEKHEIYPFLADVTRLRALPKGTLGRAYIDGLDACGLTIQGFREAQHEAQNFSFLPEEWRLPQHRILDIHDILHTATGYGRDPLGEVLILEFQGTQYFARGWRMLAYAGGMETKRRYPGSPIFSMLRESRRIASSMKRWVLDYRWEDNLHRPLSEVRDELGLTPPAAYLSEYDLWQERNKVVIAESGAKKAAKAAREARKRAAVDGPGATAA